MNREKLEIIRTVYEGEMLKDGNAHYLNNRGERVVTDDPQAILDFLAKIYPGETGNWMNRKTFWNLDIALTPLFKLLGVEVCRKLAEKPYNDVMIRFSGNGVQMAEIPENIDKIDIPENCYYLKYGKNSMFILRSGKEVKPTYIYNISQYFKDEDKENNHIDDIEYIEEKLYELEKAFFAVDLSPMGLTSAINGFENKHMKGWVERGTLPTLADLPDNLTEADNDEISLWCQLINEEYRAWTTNYSIGYYDENSSFDYDIQSAYGYSLACLYDYRDAVWVKSSEAVKEADEGLLKGKVTINKGVKVSPICYQAENGQTLHPVNSTWDTILTLSEVRWIYRHKIGSFDLDYGYFWKEKKVRRPFGILERIFAKRELGPLENRLAKMVCATAWGKLIQGKGARNQDERASYSPLLALLTVTNTRLRVADFIYNNGLQNDVIHIATDGFRTTKRIDMENKVGIGLLKEAEQEPCMILSPGNLLTPTHNPHGLYLQEAIELMKEKPRENYYTKPLIRPLTLGEAVDRGNISKVGELTDVSTGIDIKGLEFLQDMEYEDFPVNGKELLENKYHGKPVKVK